MVRDIYNKENYVKTLVEGEVIHVVWENLSRAEVIYATCEAQIKAVQNDGCNIVMIDMTNARSTPPTECQVWFEEVMFPAVLKNPNFKALINILPAASVITKMGANRWKKTIEKGQIGFDVYETYSVADAKKLAASL